VFVVNRALTRVPEPARSLLIKHRELLKFLVVGGTSFLITAAVNYALKLTILREKPVTALTVGIVVATIISYVLNREWSFRTRGGRERHHEALLFFAISGLGVFVNDVPLLIARYLLDLRTPAVSLFTQEVSDFVSGMILGTLLAMVFRLWAFRKFVFPDENARPRASAGTPVPVPDLAPDKDVA
jgi:putative flippase GtrA